MSRPKLWRKYWGPFTLCNSDCFSFICQLCFGDDLTLSLAFARWAFHWDIVADENSDFVNSISLLVFVMLCGLLLTISLIGVLHLLHWGPFSPLQTHHSCPVNQYLTEKNGVWTCVPTKK